MHTDHSLILKISRFNDKATVIQIELEFQKFQTGICNVSTGELILKQLLSVKKIIKSLRKYSNAITG